MSAPVAHKPDWAQSKAEKARTEREAAGLPPKRRYGKWIFLAIVVLAIAAIGWLWYQNQQAQTAAAEAAATVVPPEPVMQLIASELTTIEPRLLERTVKVTGALFPERQTELNSQVPGTVTTVSVRPGDRVSAGDVLVQIDIESLRVQLDQQRATAEATRAQLALARTQLERTQALANRGVAASSSLEEAQSGVAALAANLVALEAGVRSAEISVGNATVTAPYDAVISSRTAQPGQTVGVGASLLGVVDLTSMEVRANAPVSATASLKPGQRVQLSIEGIANQMFTATLERVNPVAAEGTRTITVYLVLENPNYQFRGGMFATGQVIIDEKPDALALAQPAIREDQEGNFVLKIVDDAVVRQPIEVGAQWTTDNLVEIISGLAAGDVIVTAPLTQLEPGMKVTMVGS